MSLLSPRPPRISVSRVPGGTPQLNLDEDVIAGADDSDDIEDTFPADL